MGRPRKRRREGEGEGESEGNVTAAEGAVSAQHGHDSGLNGFVAQPSYSSFGLVSPPEFADLLSGNEVYAQAQLDPSLAGIYGPSPNLEYTDSYANTPPVDPSIWDTHIPPSTHTGYQPAQLATPPATSQIGPCTCLSLTYLTLTDLQTVPTLSFPQVIIPLRKAMATISSLTHCPTCPSDPYSAIQNISSLAALFKALLERFAKVLLHVQRECETLIATGGKKAYRIGDNDPALAHLHTGTLDCPMGFNIDLEPGVWKGLVKSALRTEMEGGGSNKMPVRVLLEEVEERQRRWHVGREILGAGDGVWGSGGCEERGVCESLGAEQIRRAMGNLDWS